MTMLCVVASSLLAGAAAFTAPPVAIRPLGHCTVPGAHAEAARSPAVTACAWDHAHFPGNFHAMSGQPAPTKEQRTLQKLGREVVRLATRSALLAVLLYLIPGKGMTPGGQFRLGPSAAMACAIFASSLSSKSPGGNIPRTWNPVILLAPLIQMMYRASRWVATNAVRIQHSAGEIAAAAVTTAKGLGSAPPVQRLVDTGRSIADTSAGIGAKAGPYIAATSAELGAKVAPLVEATQDAASEATAATRATCLAASSAIASITASLAAWTHHRALAARTGFGTAAALAQASLASTVASTVAYAQTLGPSDIAATSPNSRRARTCMT